MWVVFLYCIASFITDNAYTHRTTRDYSFYIFSIFTIIEYTLFSLFIYLSLKEKIFKTILLACSGIFYSISIYNLVTEKAGAESFDSISASLEASLIIGYCIFYFYEQIKDPTVIYVYQSKRFWVILAFLIYLSATLFLFIYAATFTKQEHKNYWGINNISDIIKNVLFSISLIMKKEKKETYPVENLYPDM